MAIQTVVGTYSDNASARDVIRELTAAGIDRDAIHLASSTGAPVQDGIDNIHGHEHTKDWGERISDFFAGIFGGMMTEDHHYYAEAVRRGSVVVTVDAASQDDIRRATEIMTRRGSIDVHEQAAQWKRSGWTGFDRTAMPVSTPGDARDRADTGSVADAITREDRGMQPAGAAMQGGGTPPGTAEARSRMGQEATMTSGPGGEADAGEPDAGTRFTQTGGVRVYRRTADSPLPAASASNDAEYRQHWQNHFGVSGLDYESYEPAYRYGAGLRSDERYRDRAWTDIEGDVRDDWDRRYPQSAWETFKDSIRFGWDSAAGTDRGRRSVA